MATATNKPSSVRTFVEYVWIDAVSKYRSKTKVMNKIVDHIDDIPLWNFDGSSTKQSITHDNTEVVLEPVALFKDPFRGLHHKMVLLNALIHMEIQSARTHDHVLARFLL